MKVALCEFVRVLNRGLASRISASEPFLWRSKAPTFIRSLMPVYLKSASPLTLQREVLVTGVRNRLQLGCDYRKPCLHADTSAAGTDRGNLEAARQRSSGTRP